MRTSRSMSCTLLSVMRAWPLMVLTRRESFSVRAEAMVCDRYELQKIPERARVRPDRPTGNITASVKHKPELAQQCPGHPGRPGATLAAVVGWQTPQALPGAGHGAVRQADGPARGPVPAFLKD